MWPYMLCLYLMMGFDNGLLSMLLSGTVHKQEKSSCLQPVFSSESIILITEKMSRHLWEMSNMVQSQWLVAKSSINEFNGRHPMVYPTAHVFAATVCSDMMMMIIIWWWYARDTKNIWCVHMHDIYLYTYFYGLWFVMCVFLIWWWYSSMRWYDMIWYHIISYIWLLWYVCASCLMNMWQSWISQSFPKACLNLFWFFGCAEFLANDLILLVGYHHFHVSSHRSLHDLHGPPQAAAAAVASKEETKSQVQTLQQECSAKGLRRALQTKWNMGRQSKMNQQQPPWFYRKLFCPGIESILWLTFVFTPKWDGLV